MKKPIIRIHNVETGEILDREMTAAEFTQYQADQAEREAKEAERISKLEAKEALLIRLGITAEEAALLLG